MAMMESLTPEEMERYGGAGDAAGAEAGAADDAQYDAVPWPDPMNEAALHGIAGDFVRMVDPTTEADPVAVLLSFLASFGAVVGRGPFIEAGGVRHGTNLFVCLVGNTAKGRKGTSWGPVERILYGLDDEFTREKTPNGLSSGEGLIWAVRDAVVKTQAKRVNGKRVDGEYEEVTEDPGIADKRLLLVESEMGQTLQVLRREGNTLSPVLRQVWDGKECLQALVKTNKAKATGAHIGMIGHVTKAELIENFTAVEILNGLGNRFLWACVRRSKILPHGGKISAQQAEQIISQVAQAVQFARLAPEVGRSSEYTQLWEKIYPMLTMEKVGNWGAATGRAEAQVTRLAMIFALLDCTDTISAEHLKAAVAVWEYCDASAMFIFGGQLDDPIARRVLNTLQGGEKTQAKLYKIYNGRISAEVLRRTLEKLSAAGLITCRRDETGGRPQHIWQISSKGNKGNKGNNR